MKRFCVRLMALLCVVLLPNAAVRAAESDAVTTAHSQATLVTAQDGWKPGQALDVGLRLRLAPGWHTYWSNPGDAGEAATVSVVASGGAAGTAGPIVWPTPQRLPEGPLMSYGYTGDVLLPMVLTPTATTPGQASGQAPGQAPGQAMRLTAKADWLTCSNVCVPDHADLVLTLPAASAVSSPSAQAPLFAQARADTPVPSPFAARIAADGTFTLSGDGLSPTSVASAWLFPEVTGAIDQVAPQVARIRPGLITIALHPASAFDATRPFAAVVVLRDPSGQESRLSVNATPGGPAAVAVAALPENPAPVTIALRVTAGRIGRLLLAALLGGLVLNLMPCVFPVLAMKAMALARLSGMERREQRLSAVFYTAGILVAFAALAGLMLTLRAAGNSVGWGFQFQSLVVVALTGWLLFVVGLNLIGSFEVGGRLMGAGQGLATRTGHGGDFATGLLAVLVATPCSAPYMAVALAGAMAAPAVLAMAVFLVMGFGLALPYLLFACVPRLASALPRPGLWMEILKQALAFPMFGAVAWLVWVASREGGSAGVLVVVVGLVLLGAAAWLFGLSQRLAATADGHHGVRGPRLAGFLSLALLLATLALLPGLSTIRPGSATAELDAGWQPFSTARLAELRGSGKPVLVDMSAAWCVSCLVNERLALRNTAVQHAFAAHGVALLKGDWTLHDDVITRFLHAHGRDGVPFYIYYPAGKDGTIWPQILTPDLVVREIDHG